MLIKYQQQQQQHRGKQVNAAAIKYIKKRDKVIQSVLHGYSKQKEGGQVEEVGGGGACANCSGMSDTQLRHLTSSLTLALPPAVAEAGGKQN